MSLPRVTFVVLFFNQKAYVEDAIRGALGQSYGEIDFVFSDDASTDGTFAEIERCVAIYRKNEEIKIISNSRNLGTLGHLVSIARVAAGDYLIVAAGDDISLPDRTSILMSAFEPGIAAVSSNCLVIDESGRESGLFLIDDSRADFFNHIHPCWVHGGAAAYRKMLFSLLPIDDSIILYEDFVMSRFIEHLGFRSKYLTDRLLKYRIHSENVWACKSGVKDYAASEDENRKRWMHFSIALKYLEGVVSNIPGRLEVKHLHRDRVIQHYLSKWPNLALSEKAKMVWFSIGTGFQKAALLRAVGKRFFFLWKNLRDFSISKKFPD